jgi:hypothetical protein
MPVIGARTRDRTGRDCRHGADALWRFRPSERPVLICGSASAGQELRRRNLGPDATAASGLTVISPERQGHVAGDFGGSADHPKSPRLQASRALSLVNRGGFRNPSHLHLGAKPTDGRRAGPRGGQRRARGAGGRAGGPASARTCRSSITCACRTRRRSRRALADPGVPLYRRYPDRRARGAGRRTVPVARRCPGDRRSLGQGDKQAGHPQCGPEDVRGPSDETLLAAAAGSTAAPVGQESDLCNPCDDRSHSARRRIR